MHVARNLAEAFANGSEDVRSVLRKTYGDSSRLLDDRRQAYAEALRVFCSEFDPNALVCISRSPARLNLMGRHVDHRGGCVNPIALNLEVIQVVESRNDDVVDLRNVDSARYPAVRFRIADEMPPRKLLSLAEWDDWTMHRIHERERRGESETWAEYICGAFVNFQDLVRSTDGGIPVRLKGVNAVTSGNVPPSAGLSSSSALFVSIAEAITHLNGLSFPVGDYIEHCGRGEWFVGTRGGSGDHAAMKYGRRGQISHISFWPSKVEYVDLPPEYRIVICRSPDEAHKAGNARDTFNQRIAAYHIGFSLWKKNHPDLGGQVQHFRDWSAENLGIPEERLYELIAELPLRMTREEVLAAVPKSEHDHLHEVFAAHAAPVDGYRVREVCLFGIAEIERSRTCHELLREGRIADFGALMNSSHDGDRVTVTQSDGSQRPYCSRASDAALQSLICRARNGDCSAKLVCQPGGYACSTPTIDRMVDTALSVDGVLGAQISGAGLGGCMMALVHRTAVDQLCTAMRSLEFGKDSFDPVVGACSPVAGAEILL